MLVVEKVSSRRETIFIHGHIDCRSISLQRNHQMKEMQNEIFHSWSRLSRFLILISGQESGFMAVKILLVSARN